MNRDECELRSATHNPKVAGSKSRPRHQRCRSETSHRPGLAAFGNWLAFSDTLVKATPLVFAGLSLGREEWPLWWFLNQRARNHARRNLAWEIPTFAILIRGEAETLATAASLVNITLLPVDSYQEAWDRLFETLA